MPYVHLPFESQNSQHNLGKFISAMLEVVVNMKAEHGGETIS